LVINIYTMHVITTLIHCYIRDSIHSNGFHYIYNWYLFITAVIQYVHEHELQYMHLYMARSPC
jgi:hypothetical protein